MICRYVGVDPGPTPGIVRLTVNVPDDSSTAWLTDVAVVQCSTNIAVSVLVGLNAPNTVLAVERFVVGHRASRSRTAQAGAQTRDLIGRVQQVMGDFPIALHTAAEVKRWATNERLDAAGLLDATKGMRHARDGARHALFTAVQDGALPDPLSKNWRQP